MWFDRFIFSTAEQANACLVFSEGLNPKFDFSPRAGAEAKFLVSFLTYLIFNILGGGGSSAPIAPGYASDVFIEG